MRRELYILNIETVKETPFTLMWLGNSCNNGVPEPSRIHVECSLLLLWKSGKLQKMVDAEVQTRQSDTRVPAAFPNSTLSSLPS